MYMINIHRVLCKTVVAIPCTHSAVSTNALTIRANRGLHTRLSPYKGSNTYVPGRVRVNGVKPSNIAPTLKHTRANHAQALRALTVDSLTQAFNNYNSSNPGTSRFKNRNTRPVSKHTRRIQVQYTEQKMVLDKEHIQHVLAHASEVLERVATSEKPTAALVYSNRSKCLSPRASGKRSLGVLSASFNPMTLAHVTMATLARDTHNLDAVTLLLTVKNVDKSVFGASLPQRLAMLQAFLESSETAHWGQTDIVVCSHPRFVDAAQALGDLYPAEVWRPKFLLGYDTLTRFFDPKYYSDISKSLETFFGLAEVIAYNRDDVTSDDVDDFIHAHGHGYDAQIDVLDIKDQNLQCASSSDVRARVKSQTEGQPRSQSASNTNSAGNATSSPRIAMARLCVPTAIKEFITQFRVYYATR